MKPTSVGLLIVVLIAVVGSTAWGAQTKSPNLVNNPSFEKGEGERPGNWAPRTWSGKADFKYTSDARTGKHSVMITSSARADASWSQTVSLLPFARYTLSCWIKTRDLVNSTGSGALINIHELPVRTRALSGTNDWTRVQTTFNTVTRARNLINCVFGGWGQSTGTAWYDDLVIELVSLDVDAPGKPSMFFSDTDYGFPLAKDPDVVAFQGAYYMYYSVKGRPQGIVVGIARSTDLNTWRKIGEILPEHDYHKKGLAAPAAIVLDGKVHLFYQSYGTGRNDAICHATSSDGIHFTNNPSNPVFRPTGNWNCGRAIDAEVVPFKDQLLLYCATRDPSMKVQKLVVASAPLGSSYNRYWWTQRCTDSILQPELDWEKRCIEAPAVWEHQGRLYMFYAGAYNNEPQQIGVAVSDDGLSWQRLSQYPILPNGSADDWNASESGHPGVFVDTDGQAHLFFQGNNDRGRSWFLSRMKVTWDGDYPTLVRPRDGHIYRVPESFTPQVTIDTSQTGHPISEYIYGQFIEHLGRCIYGGIWAEMLEDRKFYYPVTGEFDPWRDVDTTNETWNDEGLPQKVLKASPWQIVGPADAVTMVKQDAFVGEHTPLIAAGSGIRQSELGLVRAKAYEGSVWIKPQDKATTVRVTLRWGEGANQALSTTIVNASDTYHKTTFQFEAGADTNNGSVEIAVLKGACYVGTVSLMPADHVQGFRADTLALLRELDSPVYRWPGGNFVSGYDWQDGIGDRDRRPPRKNPAWTGVEHNDVGIDEFMVLCGLLDTEPYIALNTGLGSMESSREEVEYCNGSASTPMGKWRAKNGHPESYDVKWWAVGNEMYGSWQLGNIPLDQYVERHNDFVDSLRTVDPDGIYVGVGAVGQWTEQMLTHSANHMAHISEHFYVQRRDDLQEHIQLCPTRVKQIADAHRRYRRQIESLKDKNIRISMDEWNHWYGPHLFGELGTRYYYRDALGIAAGLHEFMRNSDLYIMANYAQTVNVIGCIKTNKTHAALATTGQVLKLYRREFGEIPVKVTGDFAPLDIVAAWNKARTALTVGIINPHPVTYTLNPDLFGPEPRAPMTHFLITAPDNDDMAYNMPGHEPAVTVTEKKIYELSPEVEIAPLSVSIYRLEY